MPDTIPVETGKQRDLGVEQEIFPTFELDLEDLPEVEDWTVGERYKVSMQVELAGLDKLQQENKTKVRFKVVEVAPKQRNVRRHYAQMVRDSSPSTRQL